ncbi:class I SAM-dependent methyltransferase [Anaeromyxobacter oryzae]|uniref:Methyltransferase n=1 Tax=Anaeromyxobacter oryzae TaxID=2918170 RepID=A0ABN6MWT3_9BACT|nr:class I SAM-dependent methyltransferase [Anaeromyxobacter oryzae]BDG04282.1 methyltransferase [Anaeromyxobacter oryzae]
MSAVEVLSPVRPLDFPDEWYDASDASHFWFEWRLAVLRRVLADAGAATAAQLAALDVGCGSGILASQLEGVTSWAVDGTDLNMAALERCRARRGRTLYYDVTDERPELLGRYDAVVLFDVLEHLADPRALVRSVLRHLRPGGMLVVNVPALPALTSAYDRAAGHLRRYTVESLAGELDGLGLERRVIRYWGLSLVPLLVARKALLARGGPRTIDRGFRPPLPGANAALLALMRLETGVLRAPPLGTSVMYAGVKGAG